MDNTTVLEFKGLTIHIKTSFISNNPKILEAKTGKEVFKNFPEFYLHCHNENGPAITTTHPEYNKCYVVNGVVLKPKQVDRMGKVHDNDQAAIDELEHKAAFNEKVEEILCK